MIPSEPTVQYPGIDTSLPSIPYYAWQPPPPPQPSVPTVPEMPTTNNMSMQQPTAPPPPPLDQAEYVQPSDVPVPSPVPAPTPQGLGPYPATPVEAQSVDSLSTQLQMVPPLTESHQPSPSQPVHGIPTPAQEGPTFVPEAVQPSTDHPPPTSPHLPHSTTTPVSAVPPPPPPLAEETLPPPLPLEHALPQLPHEQASLPPSTVAYVPPQPMPVEPQGLPTGPLSAAILPPPIIPEVPLLPNHSIVPPVNSNGVPTPLERNFSAPVSGTIPPPYMPAPPPSNGALVEGTPRVNSKIPTQDAAMKDHARLKQRIKLYGLKERTVRGDGNCQFRALSDQLYGAEKNHAEIRSSVVKHLRLYKERYNPYVPEDYEVYVRKMSQDSTWGDHVTLQAAADVYGTRICVISSYPVVSPLIA